MHYGRLLLYTVSLALLGLCFYFFSLPAIEYNMLATTIWKYFVVSFLLVSADTAIRLNGSPYMVLPIVMSLSLLMEGLFGVTGATGNIASQFLQVSGMATTASILIRNVIAERKEGLHPRIHTYMNIAAAACMVVALRFLVTIFTDRVPGAVLHYWTLAGFGLLAIITTAAFVNSVFGKHRKEREVFLYLLYFSIFCILVGAVGM